MHRLMQMCLVKGHAIFFHIKQGNKMNAYHRSRTVSLIDAFITSGKAALETIRITDDDEMHFARRYQDGLETNAIEQDIIFIIW